MKCLIWYCKDIEFGNIIHSEKIKTKIDNNEADLKENNVIMPWITIESLNDSDYFDDFLLEIRKMCKKFNTKKIVLTPFAHLSNNTIPFKDAFKIICEYEKKLTNLGFIIKRGHFGSAKDLRFYSPANKHQVVFRSYPKPEFLK